MTTRQIHDGEAWQWQLVLLRIIILVAAVGVGAAVARGVTDALEQATGVSPLAALKVQRTIHPIGPAR
jgi:hypothetical protein